MSVLNSLAKFFGDFIFATSLGLFVFILAFSQFINYDNVQPLVSGIFERQVTQSLSSEQIELIHTNLTRTCDQTGNEFVQVPLQQGEPIRIKCSDLSGKPVSDFPKLIGKVYFDQIYFKSYSCELIECFRTEQGTERFLVVLSDHAYKQTKTWINYLLIGIGVGLILLAVSIRTWYGVAKNVGISCIFVGISYFLIPMLRTYVERQASSELSPAISPILENLIAILQSRLLPVLIIGIILTVIGFGYGLYIKRKVKK